jgi:membrane fusion protein (multidrug efflux system)
MSKKTSKLLFAVVPTSIVFGVSLLALGCKSETKASAQSPPPPTPVTVMEVGAEDVPIFHDYTAQTYARDMVEVRGRVDGYLEKRLFQVGSDVEAGQELYVLDVRPYEAEVAKAKGNLEQSVANLEFSKKQVALAQAEADLAQAQANMLKAQQDVTRLEPLVKEEAAAQQDLDNAVAALKANQASVNARKAAVEQARLSTRAQIDTAQGQVQSAQASLRTADLNLEYAYIRAPVSGRIGDTLVQVGGLVTRGAPQPLTTIVPLDPIWVRFKVSEAEYLAFKRRPDQDETKARPLQLILADGQIHPHPGHYENTVNQVDPKTGTLELQAKFPNPQRNLLPGQFGRVRLKSDEKKNVILVPQRAVQEMQGLQSVLTVGPGNKALARSVVTGERVDERWIIQQGLKPGDRVIVDGLQRARPGAVVNPEPMRKQPRA